MPKAILDTAENQQKAPAGTEQAAAAPPVLVSWPQFMIKASEADIQARLEGEIAEIVQKHAEALARYCLLCLYDPDNSITSWHSNRIYQALQKENPTRAKDVLLVLASPGGRIEPAYQISKLCKAFANQRFAVAVPRAAKSAATLIALGADIVHMGMLGELGPIDPQVGNLPALGVKRALETIASVCERNPGSSEAFAGYMARKITIEQIGYCERVAESAVQYAERLLGKKEPLRLQAATIANQLVYGYKDHGFVIDVEEARTYLGGSWIEADSREMNFAEELYGELDYVDLGLNIVYGKQLSLVGSFKTGCVISKRPD